MTPNQNFKQNAIGSYTLSLSVQLNLSARFSAGKQIFTHLGDMQCISTGMMFYKILDWLAYGLFSEKRAHSPNISCVILILIVSITPYSIVIGSPHAYLISNWRVSTWVSNYSCPI